MDKAILTKKDIDALFEWRDEHKDFVRSMPPSLRGIEIICKDSGFTIRGFRNSDRVDLHLALDGKPLGAAHFEIIYRGNVKQLAARGKNTMKVKPEELQSVITLYCSLMALMAYGCPDISEGEEEKAASPAAEKEPKEAKKSNTAKPAKKKKPDDPVTYLMRRGKTGISIHKRGGHAKPNGIFSVRGHYRHYKNGSVVWIDEYKKGTGKRRSKIYKL